jgi:hypothetical protein
VDSELMTLASTASTTLVALMATDGWERFKAAFAGLWQRAHPESAAAVAADLDDTQRAVEVARGAGNGQSEAVLAVEWQGRLMRLMSADPSKAAEIQRLVAEFQSELSRSGQAPPSIQMTAEAKGHARVYQAGRDQRIIEP